MILERDSCCQALTTHDPQSDGRFFVGVSSTGIYCRPVCRARRPKPGNCSFFASAAAAEAAGFRPCLLCRPELAPRNAGVDAASHLACRAALLIEDGMPNHTGSKDLALRLGIGADHLDRVFQAEFGVSPAAFARTHRLLSAKRLLSDTGLSPAEIASTCGFDGLRRFEALFQKRYRLEPMAVRKKARASVPGDAFRFELGYRPPLDWAAFCSFLGRRTIEGVEAVRGHTYYRTIRLEHDGESHAGWIAATPSPDKPALALTVSSSLAKVLPRVLVRAEQAFDLACTPQAVAAGLGELAASHPGLRVPGGFDGFELLARAILGQQVTVQAGRTLATRLAHALGEPLASSPAGLSRLFPSAARVAECQPSDVQALGVVGSRARCLVRAAQAVARGEICLEPGDAPDRALASLLELPGVGRWTAGYVMMRALSLPDHFLATDHGVLSALGERDPRRAVARAEVWRPWRSYAVVHLWQMLDDRRTERPRPCTLT